MSTVALESFLAGTSVAVGQVTSSFGAPSVAGQTFVQLTTGSSVLRSTYPALSAVYPVGSQPRPLMIWTNALVPPSGWTIGQIAFDGTTYAAICYNSSNQLQMGVYTSTNLATWTQRFTQTNTAGATSRCGISYLGGTPAWIAWWYSTSSGQNFFATAASATGTWTASAGGISSTNLQTSYGIYGGSRAFQLGAKTLVPIVDVANSSSTTFKLLVSVNSGSTWSTVDVANGATHGTTGNYPQIIYCAATGYIYVFTRVQSGVIQNCGAVFQCLASADWSVASNWSMLTSTSGAQLTSGYQYALPWNDAIVTPGGALLVADQWGIRRSTSTSTNAPVFSNNLIPAYYDNFSFQAGSGKAPLCLFTVGTKIYCIGYNLTNWPGEYSGSPNSVFSRNNMILLCSLDDGLTWTPVGGGPGIVMPQTVELFAGGAYYFYSTAFVYNASTGALINPCYLSSNGLTQGAVNLPENTDATTIYIPPQTWFAPLPLGWSYYMRAA
jgi:hypothetical protein